MKFKISEWIDTKDESAEEFPTVYGIQANNGEGWRHVAEDGKPLFFDTQEKADKKLGELKERYAA